MPDTLIEIEVVTRALRLACRAPSLHNSQPWRWELADGELRLFLDRDRVIYSTDRTGREALVSCGAVLDHLRVATAAAGWTAHVERLPNPNNPDHLASIDFTPMEFVTEGHRHRADAILARHTDRLPFTAPTGWDALESMLRNTAQVNGVRFDVLSGDARPQLVEASTMTESLRLYDYQYHNEMRWWTADFEVSDGIPYSALLSAPENARVNIARGFPITRHPERRTEVPEDRSKIVVLSTYDVTREDALRCGEALSGVLLDCTMAGLATCPVTHITELAVSRDLVAALIDQDTTPQVLIRVGLAPPLEDVPPATPRRPLDDVLTIQSAPDTPGVGDG